ncbi:hypothetical protein HQ945_08555 [Phyllobacterium sp. BT25]|uniref:Uncharacterized protein n=1 Tax=Phyllobacterium pellucidum TaxID=2740464 RepID=A0A849VMD5_9HYPH|nr:hypothetical protein [Phyllobacterium pellucidum]NTS31305.1 hypothetical protein [Phyllobacterium pellucidum]
MPKGIVGEKIVRFWRWNGDGDAPQFTHWTNRGTIKIRAKTPGISSEVLFNGLLLGIDDILPIIPAENLHRGNYDKDAGFKISEIVPAALDEWNDLGG